MEFFCLRLFVFLYRYRCYYLFIAHASRLRMPPDLHSPRSKYVLKTFLRCNVYSFFLPCLEKKSRFFSPSTLPFLRISLSSTLTIRCFSHSFYLCSLPTSSRNFNVPVTRRYLLCPFLFASAKHRGYSRLSFCAFFIATGDHEYVPRPEYGIVSWLLYRTRH